MSSSKPLPPPGHAPVASQASTNPPRATPGLGSQGALADGRPIEDFDANQFPLDPGLQLLEASAGTGKTFALAHLVLRLVAERQQRLQELLVVTFTEAAAGELRDRIARRLQQGLEALEAPGDSRAYPDATLAQWHQGQNPDPQAQWALRARLLEALEDLDRADITTIHGFCRRSLQRQALEAGLGPAVELESDDSQLRLEIVHDYWQGQLLPLPPELLGGLQERGLRLHHLISVLSRLDSDPALELDPLPPEIRADQPLAPQLVALWPQRWQRFVDLWHQNAEALEQAFCSTAADLRARFGAKAFPSACQYSAKPRTNRVGALRGWIAEQVHAVGQLLPIGGGPPGAAGLGTAPNRAGGPDSQPQSEIATGSPAAMPSYRTVVQEPLLREYFHPGPFTRMVAPYEDGPITLPQRPLLEAIAELVDGPLELTLLHFGHWARQELGRRRQRSGRMGFAQLLEGLDPGPSGQDHAALIAALGRRYRVALVDEFQDTDPIQWRILERAFLAEPGAKANHLVVLVGDPKQAIYRFRGGDLATYQRARARADGLHGLRQNRRSSQPLVRSLNALMAPGLPLSQLEVPAVDSCAEKGELLLAEGEQPLQLLPLDGDQLADQVAGLCLQLLQRQLKLRDSKSGPPAGEDGAGNLGDSKPTSSNNGSTNNRSTNNRSWDYLSRNNRTRVGAIAGEPEAERPAISPKERPLSPGDLCLLVGKHREAEALRLALQRRGLPSRLVSVGDVFASAGATGLQRFLDALADPGSSRRLRLLAASPMLAWSAQELAEADPGRWDRLAETISRLALDLPRQGLLASLTQLLDHQGLARLALGGRLLADLMQAAELVQERMHREQLGAAAAADWLRGLRLAEDRSVPANHQLHSDAAEAAIAVVTVYRSKGLEYPVVICPYLWQGQAAIKAGLAQLGRRWQPAGASRPRLDLHLDPHWGNGRQASLQDQAAQAQERERLAYVAATRAQHLLVLGLPMDQARDRHQDQHQNPEQEKAKDIDSAMAGDDAKGKTSTKGMATPKGKTSAGPQTPSRGQSKAPASQAGAIGPWLFDADGHGRDLPLQRLDPAALPALPGLWQPPATPETLACGPVPRHRLDRSWARSSYSGWTHGSQEQLPPQVSEEGREADLLLAENDTPVGDSGGLDPDPSPAPQPATTTPGVAPPGSPGDEAWSSQGPLGAFPRGAGPGDALHRILEQVDFQQGGDSDATTAVIRRELARAGLAAKELGPVQQALEQLRHTPLGGPLGRFCLAELPPGQRLNEMGFDLPLAVARAGTPGPGGSVQPLITTAGLAQVFANHPGGLFGATYGRELERLSIASRGFLTGSMDLVCCVAGRWWVLDWKSNWIGERGPDGQPGACGPLHYSQAAMVSQMVHHHYPLQAHLYLVALHRYLRWRLPGYDPRSHLGGYAYLFLRGLPGPTAADPVPGCLVERPPLSRVLALDALLRRGTP